MAQDPDYDRISRKAHEIWESEGRPHGRDQQHWDQAKEIVALHDSMGDTLLPRETGASEPDESKEVAEAAGDVPNLTDQGRDDLTDIAREPEVTKPKAKAPTPAPKAAKAAPAPAAAPPKPAAANPQPAKPQPAKPQPTKSAAKPAGKPAGKR